MTVTATGDRAAILLVKITRERDRPTTISFAAATCDQIGRHHDLRQSTRNSGSGSIRCDYRHGSDELSNNNLLRNAVRAAGHLTPVAVAQPVLSLRRRRRLCFHK